MPVPAIDLPSSKSSSVAVFAAGVMIVSLVAARDASAEDSAATAPSDDSIRLADAGDGRIESVTVTARRREEDVQNVPIPIATLGGEVLESSGQFRLEDLNRRLPSMNVQFSNPRQSSVAVRGLGNNPANDALEASVGVYLDNVYLGRPGMANLDLIDIDQVALLRGPQGTLFGKNTTAGVLAITTRQPSFTPEAQVEASVANRDYYQTRAAFSGPLIGNVLAGRLSFAKTSKGGFVEDINDGRDLNDSDRIGFRGQLLYQPAESLSVRVIGDYNEEDSNCCVTALYGLGPNDGALVRQRYAALGATFAYDPDFLTTTIDAYQHMDVRQGGGSIEANWEFGRGYKLTSVTAYRSWWFVPTNDGDATDLSGIINAGQKVDDEQWSQELRIASPEGGAIDYVAGLFYFYQYQSNQLFTQYGPAAGAVFGRPFFNNASTQTNQYLHTESGSVFGQATWHATDRWSLTAGVREIMEDKSTQVQRKAPVGGGAGIDVALGAFDSGLLKMSDTSTAALLSAAFQASEDWLWYASASKGAKSGGINPSVPNPGLTVRSLFIEPEQALDYEFGFKSSLFDRSLQLNANLFWTDVKDYQATQLELSPQTQTFTQVLSNIGKVRSRGVETEITAVPVHGLTLALAASYNDAEYLEYRNAPCAAEDLAAGRTVCDLTGEEVVAAPRWIVNPSVGYRQNFGAFEAFAQSDYAWRSSFYGAPDNSQYSKVDPYGVLNAQLGITGQLSQYDWQLSLWARNLLDKHYVIGGITGASQFLTYSLYPGEPRAYGATFRVNF
jgi:iron complex outermembrane receptor protein